MKGIVFVDAETDGLYGQFLSVAMIAIDNQGIELERMYCGRRIENCNITSEWVKENVVPAMGEYDICSNEEEIFKNTWNFWLKYKESSYCIADVPYPVEARLFHRCVEMYSRDETEGPFPLLDLSSMLYAKGINPLSLREELLDSKIIGIKHNALYDIKIEIEIWKKYFKENMI